MHTLFRALSLCSQAALFVFFLLLSALIAPSAAQLTQWNAYADATLHELHEPDVE